MSVVICTDLSGREPHRQVGVVRVIATGSLSSVMVSMPAQYVKGVGSIPALGAIFSSPATTYIL